MPCGYGRPRRLAAARRSPIPWPSTGAGEARPPDRRRRSPACRVPPADTRPQPASRRHRSAAYQPRTPVTRPLPAGRPRPLLAATCRSPMPIRCWCGRARPPAADRRRCGRGPRPPSGCPPAGRRCRGCRSGAGEARLPCGRRSPPGVDQVSVRARSLGLLLHTCPATPVTPAPARRSVERASGNRPQDGDRPPSAAGRAKSPPCPADRSAPSSSRPACPSVHPLSVSPPPVRQPPSRGTAAGPLPRRPG